MAIRNMLPEVCSGERGVCESDSRNDRLNDESTEY